MRNWPKRTFILDRKGQWARYWPPPSNKVTAVAVPRVAGIEFILCWCHFFNRSCILSGSCQGSLISNHNFQSIAYFLTNFSCIALENLPKLGANLNRSYFQRSRQLLLFRSQLGTRHTTIDPWLSKRGMEVDVEQNTENLAVFWVSLKDALCKHTHWTRLRCLTGKLPWTKRLPQVYWSTCWKRPWLQNILDAF